MLGPNKMVSFRHLCINYICVVVPRTTRQLVGCGAFGPVLVRLEPSITGKCIILARYSLYEQTGSWNRILGDELVFWSQLLWGSLTRQKAQLNCYWCLYSDLQSVVVPKLQVGSFIFRWLLASSSYRRWRCGRVFVAHISTHVSLLTLWTMWQFSMLWQRCGSRYCYNLEEIHQASEVNKSI